MAPREKKPTKSFDDDLKRKKTFFKQRFPGFKKKATELSVLCGNSVGFICYGPDNDVHVWPDPQDNPQALPEIVAKFNAMSDQKRKNHACDLHDFPILKGLSADELMIHLSHLNSHLLGVRRQKMAILMKMGSSDADRTRVPESTAFSDLKDMVSSGDNHRVSDQKLGSCEDQSSTKLGFGGAFDELGYVVRGSHETVSNLGSFAASKVSRDVGVSDSSQPDPFALGLYGSHYFSADPTTVTYNSGVCANDGVWDPSWIDLEFSSTIFADDWTVSGYDPFLGATDSLMASTYETLVTDNFGGDVLARL